MSGYNPLVLIVGPTASGKSALGLKLAQKFGGSILNGDSLQAYVRLDIGTAKPSVAERKLAPHFLFDYVEPGAVITAGDYRRDAIPVLEAELPNRPVFAVGGSGFYLQALERGMHDVPKPRADIERGVRARAEALGPRGAWSELAKLDPERAAELNPNDLYRVTRALIIIADQGKKASVVRAEFRAAKPPWPVIKFGLDAPREVLGPRVQKRTAQMLAAGLVQEVRALISDHLESWAPLESVGYKECGQFLRGEIAERELAPLIIEKTLQLAKKQRTWFRRDPEIHWLEAAGDPAAIATQILAQHLTKRDRTD